MALNDSSGIGQARDNAEARPLQPWIGDPAQPLRLPEPRRVSRPTEVLALVLIAVTALILRLATLDKDSLWIDEGYSLAAANLPLSTMWSVPFDTHPALHFTFVKMFSWIDDPEWAVRLPSVLFAMATLVPLYLLARRQLGNFGALVAITLWALSYTQIVHANNGRNYTELLFFLILALHAISVLAERFAAGDLLRSTGVAGWAAVYGVGALGALYTHNTAVLYLFALNGALCAWQLFNAPRAVIPFSLRLAAVNALPLLLWMPWFAVMLTATGGFNWLEQKTIPQAVFTLAAVAGPNDMPALAALAFFAVLAAGWALVVWRASLLNVLIAFHLAIYPAIIWLVGFVYVPIFMERIILIATLGVVLAIGALAAKARPTLPALGLSGLAVAISLASASAYQLRGPSKENLGAHLIQDWREAIADAENRTGETGAVGFTICDTFSWPVVATYAQAGTVYVHRPDEYWEMTMDDWLGLYGQPVDDRLETQLADMTGPTRSPAELRNNYSRFVFLQKDIYCQGEEADQIHDELTGAGFRKAESRDYRGLTAHDYVR